VTFLAAAIALHGAPAWQPGPNLLFTVAGLLGVAISVAGNETAQPFGRMRMVAFAMGTGAVLSLAAGVSLLVSAPLAALCVMLWNAAIYLDSAALTTGTLEVSDRARRGATMGLHSMCGYAGGFVGPIGVGIALDLMGPEQRFAWLLAFGHLAVPAARAIASNATLAAAVRALAF
jgi:MFS family permease